MSKDEKEIVDLTGGATSDLRPTEIDLKDLIPFEPQGGMKLEKWLGYFELKCSEAQVTDEWKLKNIAKFLRGDAQIALINSCLEIKEWAELKSTLQELFFKTDCVDFSEFSNLKYKLGNEIEEYYHKKLEIGQRLGLSKQIIIEGLTEGLDPQMRLTMVAQPPQTTTDWLILATKLVKIKTQENRQSQNPRNNFCTPRFEQNQMRPYRQNFYQQQPFRQQFSPVGHQQQPPFRNWQPRMNHGSGNRFFTPRPNNQTNHHQISNLPPRPCRKCKHFGITNAYHWEQQCTLNENSFQATNQRDSRGNYDRNQDSE